MAGGATAGGFAGGATAGGTAGGASAGGSSGGGTNDAGVTCVTWRQSTHGFSSTRVAPAAQATIDATANRLTARIPSASNTNDFAVALVSPPMRRLPAGAEGQLEGRFLVPTSTRLDGLVPFATLLTSSGPLVELGFDNNWELSAFTASGVLQAGPLDRPRSSQRYPPGSAHVVRVAWRAGAFRRVWIDGVSVFDDPLPASSGLDAQLTSFELGFTRYEGGGQDVMEMTLTDWVLCDAATGVIR